jgi:hypothetical protein
MIRGIQVMNFSNTIDLSVTIIKEPVGLFDIGRCQDFII